MREAKLSTKLVVMTAGLIIMGTGSLVTKLGYGVVSRELVAVFGPKIREIKENYK